MYRTVAQLDSLSNLLAAWFPGYFTRFALPEASVQGRPVFALRLRAGGGDGERRGVLLVGGTHARELMNPDAIIELAVDLFTSHANGTDIVYGGKRWPASDIKVILESLDVWLVPCMNPDGRVHSMTVEAMWRKNRRDNPGTPCDGVDLNRNFDLLWGVTQGQTSCSPCSDVYAGPSAFSEPETRNIKHLLDTRRIDCFADVHSYSELILWPWGHAPSQTVDPSKQFTTLASGTCAGIPVAGYQEYISARDQQRFQTVGARIRDAIAAVRGRSYTNQPGVALYPTTGTQSDYVYSRHIAELQPAQDLRLHLRDRPLHWQRRVVLPAGRPDTGQTGRQVGDDRLDAAVHLRDRTHRRPRLQHRHGGGRAAQGPGRAACDNGRRAGMDLAVRTRADTTPGCPHG